MIRKFTGVLIPPAISNFQASNGTFTLSWLSIQNVTYRVQFKNSLTDPTWMDLSGDVTATGATASKTDVPDQPAKFYRIKAL
jgi:hypothetical protein